MGNRAFILFPEPKIAVYLHWNGGVESITAFLDYMNEQNLGADYYGAARFVQIAANFFGGTLSIGIMGYRGTETEALRNFATEDNGAYIIERDSHGLRIARWRKPVGEVDPIAVADMAESAKRHPYNVAGEMLTELREKNDPHFKPAKEDA